MKNITNTSASYICPICGKVHDGSDGIRYYQHNGGLRVAHRPCVRNWKPNPDAIPEDAIYRLSFVLAIPEGKDELDARLALFSRKPTDGRNGWLKTVTRAGKNGLAVTMVYRAGRGDVKIAERLEKLDGFPVTKWSFDRYGWTMDGTDASEISESWVWAMRHKR